MLSNFISGLEDLNNPLLGPNLWALGHSFMLNYNLKCKILNYCMHICGLLFNITYYVELWRIRSDYQAALSNISVTFLSSMSMIKAWSFIVWQKHWISIFEYISGVERVQSSVNNNAMKRITSTYISYSRKITYFYWGVVIISGIAMIFAPSLTYFSSKTQRELMKNGSLPYPEILSSWTPFDRTKGLGYWVANVLHSFLTMYGVIIICSYDANAVAIMSFLKGQLEILSLQCSQIFHDENGTFNEVKAKENIQKCHIHHINLIKCADTFNSILSPIMFIYMIICSLMMCASAIQLNVEGTTIIQRMWILEYLFALVFQLFLFCWHSNEVISMSTKVDDGVYCASWWARGHQEKHSLILLQGQLRKNIIFTAGPFSQLTVSTFVTIIKGSYSYYTLLSNK